ncbi:MAG TPA: hypothetical protein PKD64_16570 [Pirellulaceae bacterium]|nr:hypothetical protein [Pirellulaceae bacterium]HMO93805.1 hypothetical protein [Pirellulaceae bacterium]HMP70601.1 hypothetical protein [Pirellulaceae bacterium]
MNRKILSMFLVGCWAFVGQQGFSQTEGPARDAGAESKERKISKYRDLSRSDIFNLPVDLKSDQDNETNQLMEAQIHLQQLIHKIAHIKSSLENELEQLERFESKLLTETLPSRKALQQAGEAFGGSLRNHLEVLKEHLQEIRTHRDKLLEERRGIAEVLREKKLSNDELRALEEREMKIKGEIEREEQLAKKAAGYALEVRAKLIEQHRELAEQRIEQEKQVTEEVLKKIMKQVENRLESGKGGMDRKWEEVEERLKRIERALEKFATDREKQE